MNRLARVLFALGLLLFLGRTAVAQSGDSQEGSGAITGRVTVDGKPARRVVVIAREERSKPAPREEANLKVTTDEEGRFRLTGLPPGQYVVAPSAPALVAPDDDDRGRPGRKIAVTENQTVEGIDFALERGGVITGRVTDADGRPVIGQLIGLIRLDEDDQKEPLRSRALKTFRTDDRGVYRVWGLAKGRYIVSAGGNVMGTAGPFSSRSTYPRTYHPGVTDESKAKQIEVASGGETARIDIRLASPNKGYEVAGHLVDADTGKPVTGAIVTVTPAKQYGEIVSSDIGMSAVRSKGEFSFSNIEPGQYEASVSFPTKAEYSSETATFEVKNEDLKSLEISLHRGATISGVVTLEGGSPDLLAKLAPAGISAYVQPPGDTDPPTFEIQAMIRGTKGEIGPDGSFLIQGLKAGRATLHLAWNREPTGLKIVRVEHGGIDQTGGIEIQAGEPVRDVRVAMVRSAGIIRGRVALEGGRVPPEASLFVSIRMVGSTSQGLSEYGDVDTNGAFVIGNLLPGDYELTLKSRYRPSAAESLFLIRNMKQTVSVTNETTVEVMFVIDPKNQK